MELIKSISFINFEEMDFKVPDFHKKIVRDRIKKSNPDELQDWNKANFDLKQ